METPNTTCKPSSHLAAGASILLVGVILGGVLSNLIDPNLPAALSNSQRSYQSGFDAAKQLVENSSVGGIFKTPINVRSLAGTVTAVNKNQITLHTTQWTQNPFADQSLNDRVISISSSTEIVALTLKDPKVYQTEMDAFIRLQDYLQVTKKSSTSSSPMAPSITNEAPASIAAIRVGSVITVVTADDVAMKKEFTPTKVQITK